MTQKQANDVKYLAKPVYEAIQAIAKRVERRCPECKGRGLISPRYIATGDYHTESTDTCSNCNGTGKVKEQWKWEPKVGEIVYYITTSCECDIFQVISVGDTRIIILPVDIPFRHRSLDDFLFAPEIIDVTPILHWETIEEILEGMGYRLALYPVYHPHKADEWGARIDKGSCPQSYGNPSETRQEAVMLAVIELGREDRD